jgi:energy-coupling factor transporter transmembrane protein EcfT
MNPSQIASGLTTYGIAALAMLIAALVIWAAFHTGPAGPGIAAAIVVLMAGQWALAGSGILREWARRPPPFLVMMVICFALTLWLAFSPVGTAMADRLPLAWLIAAQVFRLPLELVMHNAAVEGVMPVQMSYSGDNFDVLTGISAIPIAWLVHRGIGGRGLAIAWNVLGSVLLLVIVTIAIRSAPMIQAYGPDRLNSWVGYPPFVWLPGILVQAALLGHVLVWRKLASHPQSA